MYQWFAELRYPYAKPVEMVGANGIQVKGSTLANFFSFQLVDDIEYLSESIEHSISTKDITVKIIDGKLVTTCRCQ